MLYEWPIKVNKNFVVEIKNIYMKYCNLQQLEESKNKNLLFFSSILSKKACIF